MEVQVFGLAGISDDLLSPKTNTSRVSAIPLPKECITATNLSEAWRTDYNGSDIKGGGLNTSRGYACDLRKNLGWFRFTGAAGKKILGLA